jgi:hypothetical protein
MLGTGEQTMELNRDQIIKALEHCIRDTTCEQCNYSPSTCFIQENALSLINELTEENERLRAEGEWISVKDRLPKPFVSVLVYMPDEEPHPTVREGFINKRGEWYAGGFDRLPDEVVAWTEMPRAPKTKGE